MTIFLDFPATAFEPGVTFWREVTRSGLSPLRGAADEFATLLPAGGDAYLRVQRVGAGPGHRPPVLPHRPRPAYRNAMRQQ